MENLKIGAKFHLIKPLGFSLEDKSMLRASMDYIDEVSIQTYENYQEFLEKNQGADIYFVTRYSNQTYSEFDLSDPTHDYYFMFGKESRGIPHDNLRDNLN